MMWNEDLIPTVKLFGRNGVEMQVIGKRYRKSRQQQENLKSNVYFSFLFSLARLIIYIEKTNFIACGVFTLIFCILYVNYNIENLKSTRYLEN